MEFSAEARVARLKLGDISLKRISTMLHERMEDALDVDAGAHPWGHRLSAPSYLSTVEGPRISPSGLSLSVTPIALSKSSAS